MNLKEYLKSLTTDEILALLGDAFPGAIISLPLGLSQTAIPPAPNSSDLNADLPQKPDLVRSLAEMAEASRRRTYVSQRMFDSDQAEFLKEEWRTTREVADIFGADESRIRRECRNGVYICKKTKSGGWAIETASYVLHHEGICRKCLGRMIGTECQKCG